LSKSIYFASDFHLGAPSAEKSLIREKRILKWLSEIEKDADEIFLVGDIFDFWFEYKRAVPKGFTRLLGKLAELSDRGIKLHLFTGNHDMWMFDYVPNEIGAKLYREPIQIERQGKQLFVGHGDGLGPGDQGYKLLKKIFSNNLCQWLFARLHPNFGIWLANYFSRSSRAKTGNDDAKFLGEENEWLAIYSKEQLEKRHFDYLIFGHRHLPLHISLTDKSSYINLGDWITHFTYARMTNGSLELLTYNND